MDSNTFRPGGVARLRSPPVWEQGLLCVRFAYYMFGPSWGAQLKLLLTTDPKGKHSNVLWKHSNTQSPSWIPTAVTVPIGRILPSQVRPKTWPGVPVGIWLWGVQEGLGWDKEGARGLGHLNSGRKVGARGKGAHSMGDPPPSRS